MDGQWTLQLMRGSDCYSRFVSCSQTQGATWMRTAEPPPLPRLAATRLAMVVVVFPICQETGKEE